MKGDQVSPILEFWNNLVDGPFSKGPKNFECKQWHHSSRHSTEWVGGCLTIEKLEKYYLDQLTKVNFDSGKVWWQ